MSEEEAVAFLKAFDPFDIFKPGHDSTGITSSIQNAKYRKNSSLGSFSTYDLASFFATAGIGFLVNKGWQSLVDYADRQVCSAVTKSALLHVVFKPARERAHTIINGAFDIGVISVAHHVAGLEKTSYRHKFSDMAAGLSGWISGNGLLESTVESQQNRFKEDLPKLACMMPAAYIANALAPLELISEEQFQTLVKQNLKSTCSDLAWITAPPSHPLKGTSLASCISDSNDFLRHLNTEYSDLEYMQAAQHRDDFYAAASSYLW